MLPERFDTRAGSLRTAAITASQVMTIADKSVADCALDLFASGGGSN
jgi:hypothetical protein